MILDTWPLAQLWPSSAYWRLSGAASGPASRPNAVQGGGVWLCDMTVPLETVADIKLARALLYGLDGGVVPIIVPFYAEAEAPYPLGEPLPDVPHSDDAPFSDGTLYGSGGINASLAAPVALRATQVTLNLTAIAALQGSEHFSVTHPQFGPRMYSAIRVGEGGLITIRPPWREASDTGTDTDFNTPACVMRLTNVDDAMSAVTPPYRSALSLSFREVFPDRYGNY